MCEAKDSGITGVKSTQILNIIHNQNLFLYSCTYGINVTKRYLII